MKNRQQPGKPFNKEKKKYLIKRVKSKKNHLKRRNKGQESKMTQQASKNMKSYTFDDSNIESLQQARVKVLERSEKRVEGVLDLPDTIDGFEKEILRDPNSVELWVQYVSFVFEQNGISAARKLAHRAMVVVNFRNDDSVLNLWKARLNLEFYYGSEETTRKMFLEAVNSTDHFKLCTHMVDLYISKQEWDLAESFVLINLKKSRKGKKSWSEYIKFLMKKYQNGDTELLKEKALAKVKEIAMRAKQSLNNSDYIFFLTQKGLEEFRAGTEEMGRTSFEKLVAKLPKRADLWNLYVDMESKHGQDPEKARALFDRVIGLRFKVKNMKTFFMKYLQFEKKQGNAKKIEAVKRLASQYVQNQMVMSEEEEGEGEGDLQEDQESQQEVMEREEQEEDEEDEGEGMGEEGEDEEGDEEEEDDGEVEIQGV